MKRTQLNINIDPNLLKEIKTSARKEGKSLVEYVNDFFIKHLNNDASDDVEIRLSNHENRLKFIEVNMGLAIKQKKKFSDFTPQEAANFNDFVKAIFEKQVKKKKYNSTKDACDDLISHLNCFDKWNERCSLRLKEILFIDQGDSLDCDEMNFLKDSQMCPSPLRTGIINWINNSEKGKCSCSNSNFPSCLLYTSPSPRDVEESRIPSSA